MSGWPGECVQGGQEGGVEPDLAILTEYGHLLPRPGGQQAEQSVRVTRGPGADNSHLTWSWQYLNAFNNLINYLSQELDNTSNKILS